MLQLTKAFLFCSVLFGCLQATAQGGCTDTAATNYDPSATTNDGSCVYPVTHHAPVLRAVLPSTLHESSGLVWTDGNLWSHNDSGDPPDIYRIDTTTGEILQTVIIDNYPNVDWEDITADSNYIYIGDHGNNHGTRTDLKVLKIAKADITSDSVVHVNAQAISFSYTDQTSFAASSTNNFDCEALISIGDSLYIFTKDRGDLQSRVYKMTKVPGTYALSPYTSYNVGGLITGADYNAVTNEVVLIGYLDGHFNSFLWFLNDFQGDMFFSGNKRRIEIGNSTVAWQTEGVAWLSADRYFISCEMTDNVAQSLYLGDKSFPNTTSIKNTTIAAPCTVYPNPASGMLYVDNLAYQTTYEILDLLSQPLLHGILNKGNNTISLDGLPAGIYFLSMQDQDGEKNAVRFVKE